LCCFFHALIIQNYWLNVKFCPALDGKPDFNLYGGLASFHINDDAKEEALSRGYFVLQRSGDVVCTESARTLKYW